MKTAIFLFYAVTAVIIFNYAKQIDVDALLSLSPKVSYIILAIIASTISRFVVFNTFRNIIGHLVPVNIGWIEQNYSYARSWIGRYIPGKVAGLLARVYFYAPFKVPSGSVVVASVLEVSLWIFSGFIVWLVAIAFPGSALELSPFYHRLALGAAFLTLLILLPVNLNLFIKIALKFTGRAVPESGLKVGAPSVLYGSLWAFPGHMVFGISYWFLISSFDSSITLSQFPYIVGAFGLAGSLGMVVFFTPAGLGVREMVLLPFLGKILSPEASIAVLAFVRAIELAADVLYLSLSIAFLKFKTAVALRNSCEP
jgi:uncharacterized membrane protein YbhN (UPF0104 family)